MTSSVNHNDTLGALQVGGTVMVFLFGIETLQTYHYFRRYPNDHLWLKLLVAWIWLEEIGHTISVLTGMYLLTVTQFGQPSALSVTTMPVGYAWSIVFSGTVGPIVETFFAHRMYALSGQTILPVIAVVLALLRFAGSTVAASKVFGNISLDDFSTKWGWLNTICFSAGAGSDIIITVGQCYFLYRQKGRASGQTLKLLDRLLTYTIETGLVQSMNAVVILILWGVNPHSFWWFGIFLFYTEVFANSWMAVLNTRQAQGDTGLRNSQSIERSTIASRNSQRHTRRTSKSDFEDGAGVELRRTEVSSSRFSRARVSFPDDVTNRSDVIVWTFEEVDCKPSPSVGQWARECQQ